MYKRELQQTARKSLFLKLLHLPYGILIPILISTEVTNALAGRTKSVLTTAAGILAIVFCYTCFYGRLEIAFRKEKEQAVQACKMKQYRTIFSDSFEKLYHSGLGKNLENMKDDFNAVTELMTEHRPMFAASLAEAVLFGGYLCWKNPLVGICLILISLLQVIPPLLVKKYIQVNYDKCREIEGKITDYTVSAFQGFMTIKLYRLKDWWLSHLEELFQAYIKIGSNSIFAIRRRQLRHCIPGKMCRWRATGPASNIPSHHSCWKTADTRKQLRSWKRSKDGTHRMADASTTRNVGNTTIVRWHPGQCYSL